MTTATGALDRLLDRELDRAFARRARILLGDLAPKSGDHILDCGCGMGFHLSALATFEGVRVSGVDGDLSRLAYAGTH
ncbi:MAG TPA: hypothetical protein VGR00_13525, partial [Thermoanaerobaculia bacterium]|nr:hypothetical protein [Thermoanaerobaculia bacterium]